MSVIFDDNFHAGISAYLVGLEKSVFIILITKPKHYIKIYI